MKAIIKKVKYLKEFESKFGTLHSFLIEYGDDGKAFYSCKSKEQTKFKEGEEANFIIEEKEGKKGKYFTIKPEQQQQYSGFGKALKKEQSKYSGFAVSYAKDLCIAGKIELAGLPDYATELFDLMVTLDKSIEN